jgi:cytochrome c oxidase subunit 2
LAQQGRWVFLSESCAYCHAIRGTTAVGEVGPDLTHVAGRASLAANTIPNDPADLTNWIRDPQHIKPGNHMPDVGLSPDELRAVVAYLKGLK